MRGRCTPSVSSRFGSKLPHLCWRVHIRWLIIMTGLWRDHCSIIRSCSVILFVKITQSWASKSAYIHVCRNVCLMYTHKCSSHTHTHKHTHFFKILLHLTFKPFSTSRSSKGIMLTCFSGPWDGGKAHNATNSAGDHLQANLAKGEGNFPSCI